MLRKGKAPIADYEGPAISTRSRAQSDASATSGASIPGTFPDSNQPILDLTDDRPLQPFPGNEQTPRATESNLLHRTQPAPPLLTTQRNEELGNLNRKIGELEAHDAMRKIESLEEELAHAQENNQQLQDRLNYAIKDQPRDQETRDDYRIPPQPELSSVETLQVPELSPVIGPPPGARQPRNTVETDISQLSIAASWRPRGQHPNKPLKGENANEYPPWRYAVDVKLETDYPMYPTDATRIRYALSQMEEPIFSVMQKMVYRDRTKSLDDFMGDVEHYMGIHLLADAANRELQSVAQRRNKTVTEYFHRLLDLWDKAETPERERVKKFKTILLPGLATSLYVKEHHTVREILDDARRVEEGRMETFFHHPRNPRSERQATTSPNQNQRPAGTANPPPRAITTPNATPPRANSQFGPVSKKPAGWAGVWHEPQLNPARLTPEERTQLHKQGRCWACRGSGHRSADACCPMHAHRGKMLSEITPQSLKVTFSDDEEEEKE
ncbi:hypothetical protein EYZ11_013029 [Aspergillus tanneri]|uniref:Retrotransposon gag domain-containing protein n=1 Tax=Aspergillus tanneri TaxID=1220188 RepID=A0A4V3UMJ0_9EURO|nr:hypothetical protein EYZ11_013029 [Aspergillus tanneri]